MEETPTEVVPPVLVPSKKFPIWNLVIAVLLVFILAVAVFIAYTLGSKQNAPAPTPTSTPAQTTTPPVQLTQKRIAYVKDDTIYVINADGTNKKSVISATEVKTKDWSGSAAGVKAGFSAISWKDANTISYIVCSRSCAIFSTDLLTNSTIVELDPNGENGPATIAGFNWSHDGKNLAYIFHTDGDNKTRLALGPKDKSVVVKTFASNFGGRGGSLDDNISLYFSSDDKYLLTTDTGTQPNDTDKNTIWVFDASGKEILALPSDSGWPTQARWNDTERFIYKKGDKIYEQVITVPGSQVKLGQAGYNPISINGKIYFWMNGDPPKITDLSNIEKIEGYYRPELLDSVHNKIVAIKSKKPEGEFMFPFEPAGLSVIDLRTSKATDLDLGNISLFVVSP